LFPHFALYLSQNVWGPFRLLSSHLVLIVLGGFLCGLLNWYLLPRLWKLLPRDQGKKFVKGSEVAKGKPTGAGIIMVSLFLLCLLLVMPPSWKAGGLAFCLLLAMLTGYLDDASEHPWNQLKKGLLDFGVCVLTVVCLTECQPMTIWLPVFKGELPGGGYLVPFWAYLPCATALLWASINVVNCSDGVDGLAGSLSLLGLMAMGALLYGIVGHSEVASFLLLPHNQKGAMWAIIVFTAAGGLAGYLWYNAYPSSVLMGDAGSRFLGLLLGITILEAGNPFLILVAEPILFFDGGLGLFKLVVMRVLKKFGVDTRPPLRNYQSVLHPENFATEEEEKKQIAVVRWLHAFRCPVHDQCRKNQGWSDTQVLVRFMLIQSTLMPIIIVLLIKLR